MNDIISVIFPALPFFYEGTYITFVFILMVGFSFLYKLIRM